MPRHSRIKRIREHRGISHEKLAERAATHRNYMSQIEIGKRNLSFYKIVKIARPLKISTSKLIDAIH